MNEKTVTAILLVAFAVTFVYSAFFYQADVTGEQTRVRLHRQPSYGYGGFVGNQTNHTECINLQCVVRPGPGQNQCTTNAQCQPNGTLEPQVRLPVKRVFVTSTTSLGNLGGYMGALARCQQAAQSAGLGGNWVAWVSTLNSSNGTGIIHAKDRILDARYRLLNGSFVAYSKADLLDGSIQNPIIINEFGQSIVGPFGVWTGTKYTGTASGADCRGWTEGSAFFNATVGDGLEVDGQWTDYAIKLCGPTTPLRLYCFEK